MSESLEERISQSRLLLQNPYAYLDGDGGFSAVPAQDDLGAQISQSRLLLENPYAYLSGEGKYAASAGKGAHGKQAFEIKLDEIRQPGLVGKRVSFGRIEEIAKALQTSIWVNRKAIWGNDAPNDPIEILDPAVAFRSIGFDFETDRPIGEMVTPEGPIEVAGFIDASKRYAGVSSQVPFAMRHFTAAHELGHAMLHRAEGLHRDRGLDGSPVPGPVERIEVEANKFATYFLMPAKLLTAEFGKRFGPAPFCLHDDSAFALADDSPENLRKRFKNLRGLARGLSSANQFGGRHFKSLAERFRISVEAMAIRLEELKLLEF
jgi:hypothetical protein